MIFAFSPMPTVASCQSLLPHSFHSATFSNTHKSGSFSTLHDPSSFIPQSVCYLSNIYLIYQSKHQIHTATQPHTQQPVIAPFHTHTNSLHSFQSPPLPSPTLKQKITQVTSTSPAVNGRCLPSSSFGTLHPPHTAPLAGGSQNGFTLVYLRFTQFQIKINNIIKAYSGTFYVVRKE
jgi:hypothetical protein